MTDKDDRKKSPQEEVPPEVNYTDAPSPLPITNYTLSTVCPACGDETFRLACKVRCGRCGFMWDCSEL